MDQQQNKIILSILIATVVERRKQFTSLMQIFNHQLDRDGLRDTVEIKHLCDNKEISIGKKRQQLLELATGEWIVFFDDDDRPNQNYINLILNAIKSNPGIDCVGMNVLMTTNGTNPQKCCHRLKYRQWATKVDGWDYVRNITHFNCVKRKLALRVGFKDLRWGEDKPYSDDITRLCRKEAYIDEPLFEYNYTTHQPHAEKYGIKNK
jgi:hypothetical protein